VCGLSSSACSAISGNGSTGVYGDLSFCGAQQGLDIALDSYYEEQGRAASACNFGGIATLTSGSQPTGTAAVASATSSCLAAGYPSGTGVPSATYVQPGATTTGSGPVSSGGSGSSHASSASANLDILREGGLASLMLLALMGVGAAITVGL